MDTRMDRQADSSLPSKTFSLQGICCLIQKELTIKPSIIAIVTFAGIMYPDQIP